MIARATHALLIALLSAVACLAYTPGALPALALVVAGFALAVCAREHWATVLFALLPVASFAAWTGSIFVEEFDLLLLGGLLWRCQKIDLTPSGWLLLAVWLMAMGRGLVGEGGLADYQTPWNALRVGKSLVWAVLLLPSLQPRAFFRGNLLGLAAVSFVCLWERAAFPGLGDFAAEYRTTGPFWEMHVGGAALDAYLALTFPLCVWWLVQARSRGAMVLALALFGLASHAVFSSFSRGLYAAYFVSLGVLGLHFFRTRPVSRGAAGGLVLAASAAAAALVWVFATGGYRALAAVSAVLLAALWLGMRPARVPRVLAFAALGGLMSTGVSALHDKGAYLAFGLTAVTGALARVRRVEPAVLWSIGLVLGIAAVQVAAHWGGAAARTAALVAVSLALGLAAWSAAHRPPWWHVTRSIALLWAGALMLAGCIAILAGSDFLGYRLTAVQHDSTQRTLHWQHALNLWRNGTLADQWLGAGLGRYPALSGAHNARTPGMRSHEYQTDGTLAWLRLREAYRPGEGDVLRISQMLPHLPREPLVLSARVRSPAPAQLSAAVCFKHLLYAESCAVTPIRWSAASGDWQDVEALLDASTLDPGPWYAPRDAMFVLSVGAGSADVTAVSLAARRGELLANRDFSAGARRWFFTSDHHHLPWHVKQFFIGVLLEQGVLGLLVWAACLVAALTRLGRVEPYLLASVAGCLVVGVFDTVLDVPRVALLLFCMLLWPRPSGLRC